MMPKYIIVPLAAVACVILAALALGPSGWLTRSRRALGFRRMSSRKLFTLWIVAALPWTAALIGLHLEQHFSISVHSIVSLIVALVVVLVLFILLVSLPLAVVVLSIIWQLDRKITDPSISG
jgi:hypothetical protein